MRIYISLFFLLVATLAIFAEENATIASDVERTPETKSLEDTQGPSRREAITAEECGEEIIDGKSGFYCYQTVNGQRGRYGIRIFDKNNYYCGEFRNNKPSGKGYFYYGDPETNKNYCGDVVDGKPQGYGSNQFFAENKLQMGSFSRGVRDGVFIVYLPEKDVSVRAEYKKDKCQSSIWYDTDGLVTERTKAQCNIPGDDN